MTTTNKIIDSDLELIEKVKNGCEESFSKLIKKHSGLYYRISKKFLVPLSKINISQDDIDAEKPSIFYDAITTFNPDKAKFNSWLGNVTRYYYLNKISKHKRETFPGDVNVLENSDDFDFNINLTDVNDYIDYILTELDDKRIKEIFRLRYFSNGSKLMPWEKVGESIGLSRQQVLSLHNKTGELLKKKLQSTNNQDII